LNGIHWKTYEKNSLRIQHLLPPRVKFHDLVSLSVLRVFMPGLVLGYTVVWKYRIFDAHYRRFSYRLDDDIIEYRDTRKYRDTGSDSVEV